LGNVILLNEVFTFISDSDETKSTSGYALTLRGGAIT